MPSCVVTRIKLYTITGPSGRLAEVCHSLTNEAPAKIINESDKLCLSVQQAAFRTALHCIHSDTGMCLKLCHLRVDTTAFSNPTAALGAVSCPVPCTRRQQMLSARVWLQGRPKLGAGAAARGLEIRTAEFVCWSVKAALHGRQYCLARTRISQQHAPANCLAALCLRPTALCPHSRAVPQPHLSPRI